MSSLEEKCTIRKIKDYFKFEQITGNDESLNRWVVVPDVNRPGLELVGFFDHTEPRRINILGEKEMAYINQMPEDVQRDVFEQLTDSYTPAIILARNYDCPPILFEIAQNKNFPILKTPTITYQLMVDIISFLDKELAETDTLHGVLISVFGKGVLITGDSGMGKSEVGLELIRKGHVLVSDDRVDVKRVHSDIIGFAPHLLKGLLELRGIGIIDVMRMFGASSMLDEARIDFVVYLEKWQDGKAYTRVGMDETSIMIELDIEIPQLEFPVKEGRNLAVLIEAAVTDFNLKERVIDAGAEFDERVYNYILAQTKES